MNRLFPVALGCLAATMLMGLITAVATLLETPLLDFRTLNSSHTLFALGFVIAGALGAAQVAIGRPPPWPQVVLFLVGIGAPLLATATGGFSGREYLTWPPLASLPLIGAIAWASVNVLIGLGRLGRTHPEAAWVIGIGAVVLPLGFAEAHLYLVPAIGLDIGKDMAVQWQGLDTMIGGWNAILYGVAATMIAPAGKMSRAFRNLLFLVAATGLLLTFSHHHYASPQATWLKHVAFLTSLLAAVAFLHHFRNWRRAAPAETRLTVLLGIAERWTIFAVGTGFLMALPPLNVLVHGTYVITGHAMGSMIGVNAILIFAIARGQGEAPRAAADAAFRRWSRLFDWSLGGFVAVLAGAGLVEGVLRTDGGYWAYIGEVRLVMSLLPVFGLALAGLIAWIAADCLRPGAGSRAAGPARP
jgi:nitric oxide reductase subunit B